MTETLSETRMILQQLQHTQRLLRSAAALGLETACYEKEVKRLQDNMRIDYLLTRTFARVRVAER